MTSPKPVLRFRQLLTGKNRSPAFLTNKMNKKALKFKNPILMMKIFIAVLILSIISYLSLFLYKNFYQSITQSKIIVVLAKEVALQDVETSRFEKVIELHKFKQTSILAQPVKNPFFQH